METHSEHAPTTTRPGLLGWLLDFHNKTILFRVGNWIITTYSVLAGLGFFVGFSTALWINARSGLDTAALTRFYLFVLMPSVLVGLRSFSIMLEWRELFKNPVATIVKPGYMLHGGVFGAIVAIAGYTWYTGTSALILFDGAAIGVTVGESIARLGCYVYGCCWGRPTTSKFGIRYTSPHSKVVRCAPHLHNVAIHPAQLYALVIHLAMFAALLYLLPVKMFDGMIGSVYLISHAFFRYVLETFRQDDRGKLWGPFTHTNLYMGVLVLFAAGVFVYGWQSGQLTPATTEVTWWSVVSNPTLWPWLAAIGAVFGSVYGIHYKRVGHWIVKHDNADPATR